MPRSPYEGYDYNQLYEIIEARDKRIESQSSRIDELLGEINAVKHQRDLIAQANNRLLQQGFAVVETDRDQPGDDWAFGNAQPRSEIRLPMEPEKPQESEHQKILDNAVSDSNLRMVALAQANQFEETQKGVLNRAEAFYNFLKNDRGEVNVEG